MKNIFFSSQRPKGLIQRSWNHIWHSIYSILFQLYDSFWRLDEFFPPTSDSRLVQLVHEALHHLFYNISTLPGKSLLSLSSSGTDIVLIFETYIITQRKCTLFGWPFCFTQSGQAPSWPKQSHSFASFWMRPS